MNLPEWIKNEAQIRANGNRVATHVIATDSGSGFGVHSGRYLSERGIPASAILFTAHTKS
jgi:hypothetical protein